MTNLLPLAALALLAFAAGVLAGWWGKEAQQRGALFWREGWREVDMDWLAIYVILGAVAAVVAWVILE